MGYRREKSKVYEGDILLLYHLAGSLFQVYQGVLFL